MPDCIFCKIVGGEIPSTKTYENERVIVIDDIHPVARVHSLIITKRHYQDILSLAVGPPAGAGAPDGPPAGADVMADVLDAVRETAALKGVSASGFRLISNCGADGGQMIAHLHFHIIGGQSLGPKVV